MIILFDKQKEEILQLRSIVNDLEAQLQASSATKVEENPVLEVNSDHPRYTIGENGRLIKNREIKTPEQVKYLKQKFNENPEWNEDEIEAIGKHIGLDARQVLKWNWDQKKKKGIPSSRKKN